MSIPVVDRVRSYRKRQVESSSTPQVVVAKIRKYLQRHPEHSKAVDTAIKSLAARLAQAEKDRQWSIDHPTGVASPDLDTEE